VIPDRNVLLNFNNSGLDWVYAGSIAPLERGPFNLAPASYRAAEGWRAATASEWATRPDWDDFIRPGNPCGITVTSLFDDDGCYIFATQYWSDSLFSVDLSDYAAGFVTDGVNNFVPDSFYETIYVRTRSTPNLVPTPGTLPLVGLALVAMGAMRRKA
jgi:hypothetical protein